MAEPPAGAGCAGGCEACAWADAVRDVLGAALATRAGDAGAYLVLCRHADRSRMLAVAVKAVACLAGERRWSAEELAAWLGEVLAEVP